MEVEIYVMGFGKVYIFGFVFRVENLNILCYLVEFWMIEFEVVFNDFDVNMDFVEDFIKYVI